MFNFVLNQYGCYDVLVVFWLCTLSTSRYVCSQLQCCLFFDDQYCVDSIKSHTSISHLANDSRSVRDVANCKWWRWGTWVSWNHIRILIHQSGVYPLMLAMFVLQASSFFLLLSYKICFFYKNNFISTKSFEFRYTFRLSRKFMDESANPGTIKGRSKWPSPSSFFSHISSKLLMR